METDIKPLKTDHDLSSSRQSALTDSGIARCPDILAFHRSLDRIFEKHYDYAGERHPFYELVFVAEGTVGITAEEEIYTLSAGQMLLHLPNEFHRIWSEFESTPRVLNLSFHAAAVPSFCGRVLQLSDLAAAELEKICAAVEEGLVANDRGALNEQRLRLELWLLQISKNAGEVVIRPALPSALRYAEIVNVLHEHLREPLSAQDIAELCNISLSALKKIFARYAGIGVSRYFTEMKMRYAAEQLQAGMRVGEVAANLGYFDQNYFSTVFRRVMGAPPGTFRASERRNEVSREK